MYFDHIIISTCVTLGEMFLQDCQILGTNNVYKEMYLTRQVLHSVYIHTVITLFKYSFLSSVRHNIFSWQFCSEYLCPFISSVKSSTTVNRSSTLLNSKYKSIGSRELREFARFTLNVIIAARRLSILFMIRIHNITLVRIASGTEKSEYYGKRSKISSTKTRSETSKMRNVAHDYIQGVHLKNFIEL